MESIKKKNVNLIDATSLFKTYAKYPRRDKAKQAFGVVLGLWTGR